MTRDYNKEAQDHPQHRYAYDFDYQMHRYMMRTFEPHLRVGSVLELGCYHGHFTQLLAQRFDAVHVVEASSDCIAEARKMVSADTRFHHALFQDFTPEQGYDNIFLIHTLEHLDDRVDLLQRIGGWLSEQGRLFVTTPNANAASRQIAVGMGLITHNAVVTAPELAHGHRVTYSLDTLAADVRAAGLILDGSGGVCFKGLANFQMDKALAAGIISQEYLDGCFLLGQRYPDLCSSIYTVCKKA